MAEDVGGNWQHLSAPTENDAKPHLTHSRVTSKMFCTEVKGKKILLFYFKKESHISRGKKEKTSELMHKNV